MRTRTMLVMVVAGAVAACGGEGGAAETTTTAAPSTTSSSTTTGTIIVEEDLPEDSVVVTEAIANLAERLGVAPEDIEVVSARSIVWPDGALGCPEPGEMYTQALVEGSQVLLRVEEQVYDYHAGSDGGVFLCPSDEKDGGYDFVPLPGDGED